MMCSDSEVRGEGGLHPEWKPPAAAAAFGSCKMSPVHSLWCSSIPVIQRTILVLEEFGFLVSRNDQTKVSGIAGLINLAWLL